MEVKVEYENLLEYVSKSQDVDDFADRFYNIVEAIISELNKRLENCYFPFLAMKVIDSVQEEIVSFVADVNRMDIVYNQPFVVDTFLILIIQFNHQELFRDYMYSKFIMLN
jgi:hypothetical protein